MDIGADDETRLAFAYWAMESFMFFSSSCCVVGEGELTRLGYAKLIMNVIGFAGPRVFNEASVRWMGKKVGVQWIQQFVITS